MSDDGEKVPASKGESALELSLSLSRVPPGATSSPLLLVMTDDGEKVPVPRERVP